MFLCSDNSNDTVGRLLSKPNVDHNAEDNYFRSNCVYKNLSDRFLFSSKDFSKQFAHIYAVRLSKMISVIEKSIVKKWGKYFFFTITNNRVLENT